MPFDDPIRELVRVDGTKVRELRTAKDWTQLNLSNRSHVGLRTIVEIEQDIKPNRRTRKIITNIANALACDIDVIINHNIDIDVMQTPNNQLEQTIVASLGEGKLFSHCDAIRQWSSEVAERLKAIDNEHIILYMIAELHRRNRDAISISWNPDHFRLRVPAHYYPSCLEGMSAANSGRGMYAIADTRDPIESLWRSNPDPDKTLIAERIFLFDLRDFLDSRMLDEIVPMLHRQQEMYQVRIGVLLYPDDWEHPLGANAVGRNMIVLEPDLVGGYVKDGDTVILEFISDASCYQKARRAYTAQVERSFELNSGMTADQIRRTFIEHEKLGAWNKLWGPPGDRDSDYFNKYDANIRCWIPSYSKLIDKCFASVREEIRRVMRSPNQPLKVLEIGYGTGGLTKPLLDWIDELNAPWARDSRSQIGTYIGVDSSSQMMQLVKASVRTAGERVRRLCVCSFDYNSICAIAPGITYDIICGSLVLHDILGVDPHESLDHFFELCGQLLAVDGAIVFADVFVDSEASLKNWEEHMSWVGLTDDMKREFFEDNPEMVQTADRNRLEDAARRHGFIIHQLALVPGRSRLPMPFAVLVARKDHHQNTIPKQGA